MFKMRLDAREVFEETKRLRYVGAVWGTVLEAFGAYMVAESAANFQAQGRPEKWPDVQWATKMARWMRGNSRRKITRKGIEQSKFNYFKSMGLTGGSKLFEFIMGYKILEDSGRLANSIVFDVVGNSVQIGTNLIYAATHQFGRGKIPARPFLGFEDADVSRFEEIIINWLEGK